MPTGANSALLVTEAAPTGGEGEDPSSQGQAIVIRSGDVALAAYVARPAPSAAGGVGRQGLVLCHGFPVTHAQDATADGYRELADRLAADTGWTVLTVSFRGTGRSGGNFSLGGWLADLQAAAEALRTTSGVEEVWLCGFAAGGALALCTAGEDDRICGVAAFAAPADFGDRATDARRFVAQARTAGLIRDPKFPSDLESWADQLRDIRPLRSIGKIPPRPVLIVHGSNDEVVPLLDARALADAAEGRLDLRVLVGAGHRLRHDPRAVALLIGWMDRQR
ncbi:MAG: alpha/beta fold hydrolase [Actinomycetota bacterium]|nr:alpha/beta fold hydrolase [Actinomycetota bacterium]